MSHSPIEHAESLRIGVVEFVSPDEIKVSLDIEAPESISLNAGGPRPFPRINSYVLIPVDDGFLVGQIEWITVERSAFPKRGGMKDFGLIDLPFPLRKMSLNPLGTLRKRPGAEDSYSFRRGADAFPTIGSSVLIPTSTQLRSIVESGHRRRVKIGTSPLAGNAEVSIDPDRLFGRHLAVLGNTGSGKSCSVAGLIRWSLESARSERAGGDPNTRFIVLDPNGEYAKAFSDAGVKSRVFKATPTPNTTEEQLKVPLWLWNSSEWCSFAQASTKTQKPTLIQALRAVRGGQTEPSADASHDVRRFLRTLQTAIRIERNTGSPWSNFPKPKAFREKLEKWKASLEPEQQNFSGDEGTKLAAVVTAMTSLITPRLAQYAQQDFTRQEVDNLLAAVSAAHSAFGGSSEESDGIDVDSPRPFSGESLIRSVEATAEMLNVSEHTETLLIRLKNLISDKRLKEIIGDDGSADLPGWLNQFIGGDPSKGCLSIIDLSLVPTEVIHILTAVIARITFEALQRYRKIHTTSLPTVLVMEEAHTFVKRYKDETDSHDAASVCCQVFERIAREGRKFGLGLILSSQRPSELSPTVLSQCNTFLLHRISNDRDQELVHRLVPDNLKGLLRELPSLASQSAILLGWASELPVLVTMNDLPEEHRPQSDDPDFWNVWTGKDAGGNAVERNVDWATIAKDWVGNSDSDQEGAANEDAPAN
jgi:hypothetical protein